MKIKTEKNKKLKHQNTDMIALDVTNMREGKRRTPFESRDVKTVHAVATATVEVNRSRHERG